jgi:hypothetical protein
VIRRWLISAVLAVATLAARLAAAEVSTLVPDNGPQTPGGTKFNVSVRNEAAQPLQFQLRPKGGTWTTYALSPNEKGVFNCSGCNGAFEISISTGGTVLTYDLSTGTLYAIRVNDVRRIFDVYQVP